jgi:hypothetical protein
MGTAYTPGLTVSRNVLVHKERRLPLKGEVLVKVGDTVKPDTVVARTELPGTMATLKVAEHLGVEPGEVQEMLKKKVGDTVSKDEVIAQHASFFGLFKSEVKSPVAGTIEMISPVSGHVGVREHPTPIEVKAYIEGKVASVIENEGVVVECNGAMVQGIFGVGGERLGEIEVVTQSENDPVTEEMITDDLRGKIIVGGTNITGPALTKANDKGLAGVVVGSIIDKDLRDFLGYEIGVAITGHEDINITLVATEGFGIMRMAEHTFKLLKSLEGKIASINGATQIRAGVIRPEIIVPNPGAELAEAHKVDVHTLEPGTLIRVIREPYFGKLGKVSGLPAELTKVDSGSKVRILEAELEDGRRVTVPRANVEIIAQ